MGLKHSGAQSTIAKQRGHRNPVPPFEIWGYLGLLVVYISHHFFCLSLFIRQFTHHSTKEGKNLLPAYQVSTSCIHSFCYRSVGENCEEKVDDYAPIAAWSTLLMCAIELTTCCLILDWPWCLFRTWMEELCRVIRGCGAQSTAGTGVDEMIAVKSSVMS